MVSLARNTHDLSQNPIELFWNIAIWYTKNGGTSDSVHSKSNVDLSNRDLYGNEIVFTFASLRSRRHSFRHDNVPNAMSPTTFTDFDTLASDFSDLLSFPLLCDAQITVAQTTLPLPTHILAARTPYFHALFSPRWQTSQLTKPNTTPVTFVHLLNHLLTGLPPPPLSIPQTISLYLLANELQASHLETHLFTYISTHLTTANFSHYIRALQATAPPPQSLEALLVSFLAAHVPALFTPANADWQLMRTLWRLLANAHASDQLTPSALSTAARALLAFPAIVEGKLCRLPTLLAREPPEDRSLMLDLLLHVSPFTFAHVVEPYALFNEAKLLEKYRRDATCPRLQPTPQVKFRVLCESDHPHPRASSLETSVRHVVVPAERPALRDSLLRFDSRSSLGGGAELAFYVRDPRLGTHPHSFLVGSRLQAELTLPGTEFWYAFASPDVDEEEMPACRRRWGWRFFVEAVVPKIDEVD